MHVILSFSLIPPSSLILEDWLSVRLLGGSSFSFGCRCLLELTLVQFESPSDFKAIIFYTGDIKLSIFSRCTLANSCKFAKA